MRPYNLPREEILFAAKSGFLTKKLWNEFFNPHTQGWSSIRWRGFKERGYFKTHHSSKLRDCLVLNPRSTEVKNLTQGEISSPPHTPQIDHDEIVSEIMLFIKKKGLIDSFYLEPELKRIYQGRLRRSASISRLKFPDALFDVASNGVKRKIAVEVELSRKSPKRYQEMMERYSSMDKIDQIFFFLGNFRWKTSILTAAQEYFSLDKQSDIFFLPIMAQTNDKFLAHFLSISKKT